VRSVQTKNASHFDTEKKQPVEDGVPVSSQPLSASEISSIFGPGEVSPALGNRILNVLQGRRLKGTLDLDLPADIVGTVRPRAIKAALNWLRKNRPVDEDAAVMARVEREEQEEEERIARRIEKLGLDKPQSGFYGAELGQGNDIYGRSVLKDAREKNEAKFIAEEEKRRKEWMEGEAKDRERLHQQLKQNTGLQKYDEAAAVVDEGMLAITLVGDNLCSEAYLFCSSSSSRSPGTSVSSMGTKAPPPGYKFRSRYLEYYHCTFLSYLFLKGLGGN
jgi:rhomboid-like protein